MKVGGEYFYEQFSSTKLGEIDMKIITDILFWVVFGYLLFRFFQLVIKMKQPAIIPFTEEDLKSIRRYPQKTVGLPILSQQKTGLFLMGVMLIGLLVLAVLKAQDHTIQSPYYIIPLLAILNFNQSWNLFAIVKDGVLCGGKFVPWMRIQSYQFVPIDSNHRFYGYVPEVNSGYELQIKTKFTGAYCIVTSETVKEKLAVILDNNIRY